MAASSASQIDLMELIAQVSYSTGEKYWVRCTCSAAPPPADAPPPETTIPEGTSIVEDAELSRLHRIEERVGDLANRLRRMAQAAHCQQPHCAVCLSNALLEAQLRRILKGES